MSSELQDRRLLENDNSLFLRESKFISRSQRYLLNTSICHSRACLDVVVKRQAPLCDTIEPSHSLHVGRLGIVD